MLMCRPLFDQETVQVYYVASIESVNRGDFGTALVSDSTEGLGGLVGCNLS